MARLRLAEARRDKAPEAKLSADNVEAVLTVLFAARDRDPPVADVYAVIGAVWADSAILPSREHLKVLIEGTQLFPADLSLLRLAAELHLNRGFNAEAAQLAQRGIEAARAKEDRTRFQELLAAAERVAGK